MININKLKEFIKNEKLLMKQSKNFRSEQKIMGNKPVFLKLVGKLDKKIINKVKIKNFHIFNFHIKF